MNEKERAKKYLQNKQLIIHYFKIDRDYTHITNENLLYEEEYPDFIPRKDDIVILNRTNYFVQTVAYDTQENKVYIMVMTEKEYRDIHLKRHI